MREEPGPAVKREGQRGLLAAALREPRGSHPVAGEPHQNGRLHQPKEQQQREPAAFRCQVSLNYTSLSPPCYYC